jgi:hypothetical protein
MYKIVKYKYNFSIDIIELFKIIVLLVIVIIKLLPMEKILIVLPYCHDMSQGTALGAVVSSVATTQS